MPSRPRSGQASSASASLPSACRSRPRWAGGRDLDGFEADLADVALGLDPDRSRALRQVDRERVSRWCLHLRGGGEPWPSRRGRLSRVFARPTTPSSASPARRSSGSLRTRWGAASVGGPDRRIGEAERSCGPSARCSSPSVSCSRSSTALTGRPGLWLETALLLFAAYALGYVVTGLLAMTAAFSVGPVATFTSASASAAGEKVARSI